VHFLDHKGSAAPSKKRCNIAVNFRPGEKEDIMIVIHKYLVIAIQYDYPFTMVKYCVQQLLGSLQDTPMGNSSFYMVFFRKNF
jgi:hypothetical protein